ncbi:glucose-6-phosphate isomerase [Geobacter sp. SVR]|uniref:glucose-6-phosphate isomerase n=1 Tax=Geobacter sp. SVR TaxID=2495594 RepID=UPI00143EF87E|nr:glucose-6-phosphate isomerase [Geobacter sp. SVR]BCS53791.1 glucose-6-phosphate isomerase [Geobacter sp. SVR]GCF85700.1 glucose-6-phosphate isomerase [Geobacter sp. SVR]
MGKTDLWDRYNEYLCDCTDIGLALDISRINFSDGFLGDRESAMQRAFADMAALEGGAVANPDENRMVGHYWLRNPSLAPDASIREEIEATVRKIRTFAQDVHAGRITAADGQSFSRLLVVGIGGSALGPQFVADALSNGNNRMEPRFLDNTDPDGIDRVFGELGSSLARTLTIVISKSGSTKETRNGMLEAQAAYRKAGLDFARHAVAVTGEGSELDSLARSGGWLERFPMWDWVGGRTSVTSAVGLLPAALQGIDITALLEGARLCDEITRRQETRSNPAALMALMWHHATNGRGDKDMVMLPYKDRLLLFSRYLQQLIMESLGKELDLQGNRVCQGLSVYGNKGSTDQHAYVQQLREGVANFFVTFIEVLRDREEASIEVEEGITSGDYLFGFLQGTRTALYEKGRESMTITVDTIDARTIGVLIALFERSVGLYASLININAYHQPGVEAGKKAAGAVISLQSEVVATLAREKHSLSADEVAAALDKPQAGESVFAILRHLSANPDRAVEAIQGKYAREWKFGLKTG